MTLWLPVCQCLDVQKPIDNQPARSINFPVSVPRFVKALTNAVCHRSAAWNLGYEDKTANSEVPLSTRIFIGDLKLFLVLKLVCLIHSGDILPTIFKKSSLSKIFYAYRFFLPIPAVLTLFLYWLYLRKKRSGEFHSSPLLTGHLFRPLTILPTYQTSIYLYASVGAAFRLLQGLRLRPLSLYSTEGTLLLHRTMPNGAEGHPLKNVY
jgi:hypothetical protein